MTRSIERVLLTGLTACGLLLLAGGMVAAQEPVEAAAPAGAQAPVATAGDDDPALEMALEEETGWQGEDDAALIAPPVGDLPPDHLPVPAGKRQPVPSRNLEKSTVLHFSRKKDTLVP